MIVILVFLELKYIRNINLWSHIAPKLENCFDINYEAFGAVRQVLPGYQ